MKKVLITGGAGFVGANFAHRFFELGYDVEVAERLGAALWRLEKIKEKIKIRYIDLKDEGEVEAMVTDFKPQIILHFATYGAYQAKQQDIKTTIDTNLLGTINLLNACSKAEFECFINTGSSSEYGEKSHPMKETDLLEPNNLYGITKVASIMYCADMARKTSLPIVNARLFSVFGFFEEKERLIPTVLYSCLTNSPLKLYSPFPVRDFIFIEDVIGGYLKIIENARKVNGETFNLGTGKQSSIGKVVDLAKKIVNSNVVPEYGEKKPAQIEPKSWVADISKAKRLLDWQPQYNLRRGLEENAKWLKENLSIYNF